LNDRQSYWASRFAALGREICCATTSSWCRVTPLNPNKIRNVQKLIPKSAFRGWL
jgi:hypothetical protein